MAAKYTQLYPVLFMVGAFRLVRTHILQKHSEKVEEVKKEVNFFNAYLKVAAP